MSDSIRTGTGNTYNDGVTVKIKMATAKGWTRECVSTAEVDDSFPLFTISYL